jgi:hypothetical protein
MGPEKNPHHNPESVMENAVLVEFVDVWKPITPEDLARPRYSRPVRPANGQRGPDDHTQAETPPDAPKSN